VAYVVHESLLCSGYRFHGREVIAAVRVPEVAVPGVYRREIAITHIDAAVLARSGGKELLSAGITGVQVVGMVIGIAGIYGFVEPQTRLPGSPHAIDDSRENIRGIEMSAYANVFIGYFHPSTI